MYTRINNTIYYRITRIRKWNSLLQQKLESIGQLKIWEFNNSWKWRAIQWTRRKTAQVIDDDSETKEEKTE